MDDPGVADAASVQEGTDEGRKPYSPPLLTSYGSLPVDTTATGSTSSDIVGYLLS
jgi:hypothetical protein